MLAWIAFSLILPTVLFLIRVAIAAIAYKVLRLGEVVPFRKVVILLLVAGAVENTLLAVLNIVPAPIMPPIQVTSGNWSAEVARAIYAHGEHPTLFLSVPLSNFALQMMHNCLLAALLYLGSARYLKLDGHQRVFFWMVLTLTFIGFWRVVVNTG
jgi:hypothetical protein